MGDRVEVGDRVAEPRLLCASTVCVRRSLSLRRLQVHKAHSRAMAGDSENSVINRGNIQCPHLFFSLVLADFPMEMISKL